jgi:hypothetical protein
MVGRVIPLSTSEQALAAATEAFLAQPGFARSTRRSYDQTLTRVRVRRHRQLSALTVEAVTVAVTTEWGGRRGLVLTSGPVSQRTHRRTSALCRTRRGHEDSAWWRATSTGHGACRMSSRVVLPTRASVTAR